MTDHSILFGGASDLPFRKEARAVTQVLNTLFVDLPNALSAAFEAKFLFDDLSALDDGSLAKLGIERDGIAHYALKHSGLVARD